MKFNHAPIIFYAVITTLLLLAVDWGVNLPLPELTHATQGEYQLVTFLNSRTTPLLGLLLIVIVVRIINRYRFHMSNALPMVLIGGLLFLQLNPLLYFVRPTLLALLAGCIGTTLLFYAYQAGVQYVRKPAKRQ